MGDTVPMDYYRQNVVYSPHVRDHRRRSPRLPTPEASRSSNGSLDEQVPRTYARNGMRICSLLSGDQQDRGNDYPEQRHDSTMARGDSRHRAAPRSPPYQTSDSQKPSLPPLQTVLNGTITSPPDTPPTLQSSFQHGPREPAFSASTYKPPALYPNKKPRTTFSSDPSPTFNPRSSLSSPGQPTATLEHRPGYSTQRQSVSNGHTTPRMDHESSRRQSLYQVPTLRQEHSSPSAVNYQYARGFVNEPSARHSGTNGSGPYRSSEGTAFAPSRPEPPYAHPSTTQSRPPVDYFASSPDRYALPSDRGMSRRSSVQSQRDFGPPSSMDQHHSAYPPHRSPHYSLPMRDDCGPSKDRVPYVDRERLQPSDAYSRGGYQDAQPTFFMPSHYDYQQGKTRKRSNLPKQSTEIMKTWFDQNITNPYPSEEQKAIFSNATGISMTQVSNWFINHRRRCPELRDKRDRTRVGGLEGAD